jgi:hypothetical protein
LQSHTIVNARRDAVTGLIKAGRLFGAIQGNVDPDRGLDMTLLRQTLKEMA